MGHNNSGISSVGGVQRRRRFYRVADASEKKPKTATPLMPGAQGAVTRHTLTLPNRIIRYTATAGTITLRDAKAQPTARMFCEGRPLRTATSRCITA